MDGVFPNTVFITHRLGYLNNNLFNSTNHKSLQGSENKKEASHILFRKQNGDDVIIIVRKPSGEVKGYLKKAGAGKVPLVIKGAPRYFKIEHIENAKSFFRNNSISLSDY